MNPTTQRLLKIGVAIQVAALEFDRDEISERELKRVLKEISADIARYK